MIGQHYAVEVDQDAGRMEVGIVKRDKLTGVLSIGTLHSYKAQILESQARFVFAEGGKGGGLAEILKVLEGGAPDKPEDQNEGSQKSR